MTTKTAKGYKGIGMDGLIAVWYAKNTGKNLEDFRRAASRIASTLPPDAAFLEVAPGPGYLAIELAKLGGYHITGLDISQTFVDIARDNARNAGVNVDFRQGDAAQMPFAAESFDSIYCRAAFKNFSDPVGALNEMHRVLKPGGRAVIDDLRGDVIMETINKHVDEMGMSGLNKWFTRMTFRFMLIGRAYTKAQFQEFVGKSAFKTCQLDENAIGLIVKLQK